MQSVRKARWQQATALVSLSTCGAMTGLSFAHGTVADLTSPTGIPVKLMALTKPTRTVAATDAALRAAIVQSANYYLRLAQTRSPSAMEALIWQNDSVDAADHGESCAAFASLTLESGAQATGQQSWVSGGTTYPWPVHSWVDSRVDPNPGSPGIVSILQDAQAHQRWHPVGDGYTPQPGDWVLFDGHVEVVTTYAGGVLYTVGGDSLPNLSVNAHQYSGSLADQGVTGFVNNGVLLSAVSQSSGQSAQGQSAQGQSDQGQSDQGQAGRAQAGQVQSSQAQPDPGQADVPGAMMPTLGLATAGQVAGQDQLAGSAGPASGGSGGSAGSAGSGSSAGSAGSGSSAGSAGAESAQAVSGAAAIPGALPITGSVTSYSSVPSSVRYSRSQVAPTTASVPDANGQHAFINEIAQGALDAQRQYGIPAAVTIAQAIDESGWGQSQLATEDHNLFGIKGTGPAGSVVLTTQEYQNGQLVTVNAPFRVYSSAAQSISDHGLLLATGSSYKQAMADRRSPDTFANDLTGVYATDPNYGASLITIMRQYNLYRFDAGSSAGRETGAAAASGQSGTGLGGSGLSGSGLSGSGLNGSGLSGSGLNGSGLSGSGQAGAGLGGAQPGAAGQDAAIPGLVAVNATDLGIPAQQAPAHSANGHSGPGQRARARSEAAQSAARHGATEHYQSRRRTDPTGESGEARTPRDRTGESGEARTPRDRAGHGVSAKERATARSAAGHAGVAPSASGPASKGPRRGLKGPATGSSAASGVETGGRGSNGAVDSEGSGAASIPGLDAYAGTAATSYPAAGSPSAHVRPTDGQALRAGPRNLHVSTRRYVAQMPRTVLTDFVTTAKIPLLRAKPLYQNVASGSGMRWELLAACDWMQCQAQPGVSPVYGESLGTKNPDGTVYRTKADALDQCAADLIELAAAVYGIDLRQRRLLSVRELANVFAAFRWGGLLKAHGVSAMDFPYSVEGLSPQHTRMRWPDISDEAPDKPGTRFRMAFGAVPVVLRLNYPAIA